MTQQPHPEDGDQVQDPEALLRVGSMIASTLQEIREVDLDESSRRALVDAHRQTVNGLREILSDDLRHELEHDVQLRTMVEETPSEAELRVAQARLLGWLEGVLRGLQASALGRQMAAQLEAQRRGSLPGEESDQGRPGYL